MTPNPLGQLLEDPQKLYFYNLLGGLADDLLTTGGFAGTFLTCGSCGDTFTLKESSWKCEGCGHIYELKFNPVDKPGTPFLTTVRASGLSKPRWKPHWYFEDENWCVAEFLMQVLRLPAEVFLPEWLNHLGAKVELPAQLETILCWPRLRFGKKTIQPDFVAGFRKDFVFIEFKRPQRGTVPPRAIMGQIAFAVQASRVLNRRWRLVIVPGRDSVATKTPAEYVLLALGALGEAQTNWLIPGDTIASIKAMTVDQLAEHVTVVGWERLIHQTCEIILKRVPSSWTREHILAGLQYFQSARATMQLMDAVDPQLKH